MGKKPGVTVPGGKGGAVAKKVVDIPGAALYKITPTTHHGKGDKKDHAQHEEPKEDMVPKAECEKRVSGMQSAMAKQMDALKKDYDTKIEDFKVQMKAKDEELTKAKAEVTSLTEKLEKSNKELSDMTSTLMEKTNALDALNAGVNTPAENDT